jgi:hypothetical protein
VLPVNPEPISIVFTQGDMDGIEKIQENRVNREPPEKSNKPGGKIGCELKDVRGFYIFASHPVVTQFGCEWLDFS